jgi:hypothetical protein
MSIGVRRVAVALLLLAALSSPSGAQAPDTPEPGSREAIAAATTEPRFLSPWTSYVPDHPTVPSPTKYLGHIVGAPGELTRTDKLYGYYRSLAAASPRVQVEVIGKTEEGRDLLLVIVGDEAALKQLDRYRRDMDELADPRRCDEVCMEQRVTAPDARVFYMLHGGLHSGETGPPEMLMELAHRLAVSETPLVREIRSKVIVLIQPCGEPDGRDRAVDWFYRHLKGKTDYDNLPPITAPYWGKYARHDNNRDGNQRKLALTRATQDAWFRWHPLVMHDLHESVPLLAAWTGTGPYTELYDASTTNEWHAIAFNDVAQLGAFGMPGAWAWGFDDGWAHLFADSVANTHNAIGRGYETFGNGTAETVERRLDPERNRYTGRPVTDPDWYRPAPPPKGKFKWSLRNNTNYMQTGVLAALRYAARNGGDMARSFWRRGQRAIQKGASEKPYAIAIPEKQDDKGRLAAMVNLLREHRIEVSRAKDSFKVKEGDYPAGTYLIRLDQPYRNFALDLMLPQKYPADKAQYPTYDDASWALPVGFGVETKLIDDPAVLHVAAPLVTEKVAYQGSVDGDAAYYLVRDTGQEALLAARVRLAKFKVEVAEQAFASGGVDYPAGSWVIPQQKELRRALDAVAAELGLDVGATDAAPGGPRHALDLPRLALLQSWRDTQSAGWLRMVWDDEKIPYTLLSDDDVKAGSLRTRFDVIVMPNTGQSLKDIVNGIDTRFSPLAYNKSPQYPTHGLPNASPDITGGFTWRGVANLEDFVRSGGVLVTLGGASTLPLDGGIARDVSRENVANLYTPGSELRARFRRTDHPIAYGYKETLSVHRANRPVYGVRRADQGRIVMQWGTRVPKDEDETPAEPPAGEKRDPLVVSGGVKGAEGLEGKPALLDIPTGKGRVITFDFDPIHRYTTPSDFRLLWNAVLNWNDLPPTPAPK